MEVSLPSSLIPLLDHQHKNISRMIDDLSVSQIQKRPDTNKWSIHENIAHLTCYQPVFLSRLMLMQEKENPSFSRYSADTDSGFQGYVNMNPQHLITILEADRNKIISFLKSLNSQQLLRTGTHPKFGTLSIVKWLEFFLLHEAHHMFTIFQLKHSG
jgi:uncharacterized damage-inducible protein DinB